MKKYLACAPALLLLAACGGSEENTENASASAAAPSETSEAASTTTETVDTAPETDAEEAVLAQADTEPDQAPSAELGRKEFNACAVCHSVREGDAARVGPNLFGVYGQPAAQSEEFNYSPAMRDAGLVWDDETLDAFMENPRDLVPKNRMAYVGQRDPLKRAHIIEYMKTLMPEEE